MLELFGHPFSSFTWKATIGLWEKEIAFDFRLLEPSEPENVERLRSVWPLGTFPVLIDDGRPVIEAGAILEYCDARFPDTVALVPDDPMTAAEVRMLDSIFDSWVMHPMQAIVAVALDGGDVATSPAAERARNRLEAIYPWLDGHLAQRHWAAGDRFTLADCAAAPALFYADWVQPIDARHEALRAYRARLLAYPPVARAVEGARPYRAYFPLGAPDRD